MSEDKKHETTDTASSQQGFNAATIAAATEVDPGADIGRKPDVATLPPFTRAGFNLATSVLWILAINVILILVIVSVQEFRTYPRYLDPTYTALRAATANPPEPNNAEQIENFTKAVTAAKEMVESVGARQKETREYILNVAQLVLLNLFLPVLTALLGYLFGTRQVDSQPRTSS